MLTDILFLLLGLALILIGANALTDGASALAKRWGVSDLVIGLTVVAFGTSAPELVISVVSSVGGNSELAIGNVVGSNLFNVFVIIGVTAMVVPIKVGKSIMINEIPFVILSALALLAIGNSHLLDGAASPAVSRVDGILLLLFFVIFMRYTFSQARGGTATDSEGSVKLMPMWKSLIWVVAGLGGLIYGGDRFVAGASAIASRLGVSDAVIGLTIVAAGTSLPELATSVAAALKGKPAIALGNVIGSNIFNIFLVLGVSAVIRPLPFGTIGNVDLISLTVACMMFWFFGWFFKERTITRTEGAILTSCYIVYVAYMVSSL